MENNHKVVYRPINVFIKLTSDIKENDTLPQCRIPLVVDIPFIINPFSQVKQACTYIVLAFLM